MRAKLLGLALTLVVLPAWAQTRDEISDKCRSDDPDVALSACNYLIQSGNESAADLPDDYWLRGLAYDAKHLYDQAIVDYTKAIALKPDFDEAYMWRGVDYGRTGLYDRSITDYSKAIELKPDSVDVYNNRAWAYHEKGEDAKGLPDAETAVARAPDEANFIETRAEIYEKLGQRNKAIADYNAALELDSTLKSAQAGLKRLGSGP